MPMTAESTCAENKIARPMTKDAVESVEEDDEVFPFIPSKEISFS